MNGLVTTPPNSGVESNIRLENRQLVVNGEPFLVLGGQLLNSSSATPELIAGRVAAVASLGANVVHVTVSWEDVERTEGVYTFTLLDELIAAARQNSLKMAVTWFGSWKNGLSSYRPAWMKRDTVRFPLARTREGRALPTLSIFNEATRTADIRAFRKLLAHIRDVDSSQNTVIIVQVQNEVGLLGDSRDFSPAAEAEYRKPPEQGFLSELRRHTEEIPRAIAGGLARCDVDATADRSWEELFGPGDATDHMFMAYHYAQYVNDVAAAGKIEYDLPFFVNAWLPYGEGALTASGGHRPGAFPSGGPAPAVFAAWRYWARSIDMVCPDIYDSAFRQWSNAFANSQFAGWFIPEMARTRRALANIPIAIGDYHAIGVSPFGVDTDAEWERASDEDPDELRSWYRRLRNITPQILKAQREERICGFVLTDDEPVYLATLDRYHLTIRRDQEYPGHKGLPFASGLVILDDEHSLIGIGDGFAVTVQLSAENPDGKKTEIGLGGMYERTGPTVVEFERVEVGEFKDGSWVRLQHLNGDENHHGQVLRMPYVHGPAGHYFGEIPSEPSIRRGWLYEYR